MMTRIKRSISGILFFWVLFLPQITSGSALNSRFEDLLAQAEIDLEAGRLDEALVSFLSAEKIDADHEILHHKLGGVYLLKGGYPESVRYFQKALKLNAKRPKTFIGLGLAYLHLSQYGLAKAALEEAKVLSSSRKEDIDRLIMWINQRH